MAEDFTLLVGDVREQLALLPDESVHCVVTSPPYWGLRDYGTGSWEGGNPDCDHVEQYVDPTKRPASGGVGNTSRERSIELAAQQPDAGAGGRKQFRETCGKCGARRVDQQLGLEPTPEEYVENMVSVFREVRRVLRRDGTCWMNIGDCYAASQGIYPDGSPRLPKVPTEMKSQARPKRFGEMERGRTDAEPSRQTRVTRDNVWRIKPKDLMGMPWRLAFALQADGWYLRSEIIWAKPNPMPESVTDRPTKSHEQVFLLTRSPRYYFDQDAVREPYMPAQGGPLAAEYAAPGQTPQRRSGPDGRRVTRVLAQDGSLQHRDGERWPNPTGRNLRSVWEIATQPYPEAHFATYPEELVRRCVLAGTSERGCCPECGAPWERETEALEDARQPYRTVGTGVKADGAGRNDGSGNARKVLREDGRGGDLATKRRTTLGWRPPLCGHSYSDRADTSRPRDPIPCTVLDPFIGSGTTALVARNHGRRSIGIELNPAYAELAERRNAQQTIFQEGAA